MLALPSWMPSIDSALTFPQRESHGYTCACLDYGSGKTALCPPSSESMSGWCRACYPTSQPVITLVHMRWCRLST